MLSSRLLENSSAKSRKIKLQFAKALNNIVSARTLLMMSKLNLFKADSLMVGRAHEKYMDKLHTGGSSETTNTVR